MAHINLSREADAVLIAPASADFVAKLLHGRADDLLSLLCLARPIERCPLLVAPAMNREMWAHPATQRNFAQLVADGTTVLGPGNGDQACGEFGDGRMLEPDELLAEMIAFFQAQGARRPARSCHRRADVRADRSGARPEQPLERQDGLRDRPRRRRGRRRRHVDRRSGRTRHAAPRAPRRRDDGTGDARRDAGRGAATATSSSPPPQSPTGASPASRRPRSRRSRVRARRRSRWSRIPTSWPRSRRSRRRRSASASPPRAATSSPTRAPSG